MTQVEPRTGRQRADHGGVRTVRAGALSLDLDPTTGTPVALANGDDRVALTVDVELSVGGTEVRNPVGGLMVTGDDRLRGVRRDGDVEELTVGFDRVFVVPTRLDGWGVQWRWTVREFDGPGVSLELVVTPPADGVRVLRDVTVTTRVGGLDTGGWTIDAPGNMLKPRVRLADLPATTGISPAGGLRGSTALVRLQGPDELSLVVWPLCTTEMGRIDLHRADDGVRVTYATGAAGEPGANGRLAVSPLHLDLRRAGWDTFLRDVPDWYRRLGVWVPEPQERPAWARGARLWEAQLGWTVHGGYRYEPYPSIRELHADLDRIVGLGFDVIQLMPRQPFPSYTVHDYWDIGLSYAPADELRAFVDDCHRRGVRVILDVLLHGVIDQVSIRAAADGVRGGPYADLVGSPVGDAFAGDPNRPTGYELAWSRWILDIEPIFLEHAPPVSPLIEEHPEWFLRDSSGGIPGVYTRAFDARHPGWQDWFIAAMLNLVRVLDIDGFRFDAPTYNETANWSPATRDRASASLLGCLPLFRRLRRILKDIDPDLLMYTEPSGVLLRESMDMTYNYDEQWLTTALLSGDTGDAAWSVTTAQDLRGWLRDRDAVLPQRAWTCHHVDSHDTHWWPTWGNKWRREQFGLPGVRAIVATYLLAGGPYMMFVGGETGIEDLLTDLAALGRRHEVLRRGDTLWDAARARQPHVFAVGRVLGGAVAVAVVNVSDADEDVEVTLDGPLAAADGWSAHGGTLTGTGQGTLTLRVPGHGWAVAVAEVRP
jgi:glycosidase